MRDAIFREVADKIRADIHAGVYGPGDRLPPAKVLGPKYNVAPDTVKWAFRLLGNEGLVEVTREGASVVPKRERQPIALPDGAEVTIRMPSPEERRACGILFVGIPVFVVSVPGKPDIIYPGHTWNLVT